MQPRLDAHAANPRLIGAMLTLSHQVHAGLDPRLIELVQVRASQINACAFCLHIHTRDARAQGESDTRLHLLAAWRESPLFTERERAALAWTEALTRVADTHAPDEDYARMASQFDAAEQVALTLLIGIINSWNRLAIGLRYIHPVDATEAAHAQAA